MIVVNSHFVTERSVGMHIIIIIVIYKLSPLPYRKQLQLILMLLCGIVDLYCTAIDFVMHLQ